MQFLRIEDVMKMVGFRRTKIYQMIKQNKFPAPIKISVRTSVWSRSSIEGWMQEMQGKS